MHSHICAYIVKVYTDINWDGGEQLLGKIDPCVFLTNK